MEEQNQSEQHSKDISIVFGRSKEAPYLPVSGLYVGPTPDLSLLIGHLFIEHRTLPSVLTMKPEADGTYIPGNAQPISRGDWTREIVVSFAVSPAAAITIGNVLIEAGHKLLDSEQNANES